MNESVLQSIAGSVGGMGAMCITYPLVIASTRDAVADKQKAVAKVEGELEKKSKKSPYDSTIVKIYTEEGLGGLYAGLSSSLFGIGVTNAVYYFAYSLSSESARAAGGGQLTVKQSILAGLIAGSATTVITNPLWVVQSHQSTSTLLHPGSPRPSIPDSVRAILKVDGPGGLFRGLKAALILVTNPVLQYTAFEQLKNLLLAQRRKGKGGALAVLSDLDIFVLGALAKLFATSLSYPLVLLKSRLQSGSHAYPSLSAALLHILRKDGPGGLYKGITTKLLQSVLTASFLFLGHAKVLEVVRKILAAKAA
ncbi:peroxisomal membrane protein [Mrakia frigida]|uniref:peroxisomal membrane protein n=1 Tax=Mrakia frigida TaxID=29902 RepID=UPI003FCC218E